ASSSRRSPRAAARRAPSRRPGAPTCRWARAAGSPASRPLAGRARGGSRRRGGSVQPRFGLLIKQGLHVEAEPRGLAL
ncbi:MAG: hypothetical protein AVDCRST_MAG04-669, partial [uncultured Acetobacteraceae bacterium]